MKRKRDAGRNFCFLVNRMRNRNRFNVSDGLLRNDGCSNGDKKQFSHPTPNLLVK